MHTRELWRRGAVCMVASLWLGVGCGDEPKTNNNTNNDMEMGTNTNRPPIAEAGENRVVRVGETVTLDGATSSDPDDDIINLRWVLSVKPAGSQAELSKMTGFSTSFVPDVPGVYTVELIANDGELDSAPDRVSFDAKPAGPNTPPVARAGDDRTVVLGETAMLDGAGSTDAEGDALSYVWTVSSAPAGSAAMLTAPMAAKTDFTPDIEGTYTLRLIANDGQADSAPDDVTLTALPDVPPNTRPVAVAGEDAMGMVGVQVMLDGSASSDADGDVLSYSWTLMQKPATSQATVMSATMAMATFVPDVGGRYIAQLVVDDGVEASSPDTVTIDVQGAGARPPVAVIRGPRSALLGRAIQLDGSGSSDPDGDALTFSWSLRSKPAGSLVFLNGGSTAMPTLTPDQAGDYVVALKVNDGTFDSPQVELTIAASNDPFAGACLIISEYIEGSSNNKAMEVFNCSSTVALDLTRYGVCVMNTSGASCTTTVKLTNMLAPGEVYGICGSQISASVMVPAGACKLTSGVASFNGDDRILVFEDVNSDGSFTSGTDLIMDTFGEPARQPAPAPWADKTFRRCDFTPFDGTRDMFSPLNHYIEAAKDDFSNLGVAPTMGCTTDRPPIANPGAAQTIIIGATVMLDGSASSDPDGMMVTYDWAISTAPQGSTAMLMNPMSAQPSFVPDVVGAYTITLVVNDGTLNSAQASVTITVNAVPNLKPLAVAGANQTLPASPAMVMLDGSGSSDPEAQPITYTWSLVTKPMTSAAVLSATNTAMTGFEADVDGLYIAELIVNDGVQDSTPSRVNVQVGLVQNCLIISEVAEGSSFNKAVEVFNCGGAPFDLSQIGVCIYANNNACDNTERLTGTLAPGAVFTLCNPSLMMSSLPAGYTCNQLSTNNNKATGFNGDDPIILFRDTDNSTTFTAGDVILDAFGKPGVKPTTSVWGDKTFRRCDRTPYTGTGAFDATTRYTEHAKDDLSNLGTAPTAMTCP